MAADIDIASAEARSGIPFQCVVLLTESHLRWCPNRTYKGHLMYETDVEAVLGQGASINRGEVYQPFEHPLLGPRGVPVGQIAQVSLDIFLPTELAAFRIHMLRSWADDTDDGPWPIYDLNKAMVTGNEIPEYKWSNFLFMVHGVASFNFAFQMHRGFDYLEIPFKTEEFHEEDKPNWDELSTAHLKRDWIPLFRRLGF